MFPTITEIDETDREAIEKFQKKRREWENRDDLDEVVEIEIETQKRHQYYLDTEMKLEATRNKLLQISEKWKNESRQIEEKIKRAIDYPILIDFYEEIENEE